MNREIFVRSSVALNAHRAEVRRIVEANRASNARVFGSVLRGEDTEESDLDLLVEPNQGMTLLNVGTIRYRLSELLAGAGRRVDAECPARKVPGVRHCGSSAGMSTKEERLPDYLEHMAVAIDRIESYTGDMDFT